MHPRWLALGFLSEAIRQITGTHLFTSFRVSTQIVRVRSWSNGSIRYRCNGACWRWTKNFELPNNLTSKKWGTILIYHHPNLVWGRNSVKLEDGQWVGFICISPIRLLTNKKSRHVVVGFGTSINLGPLSFELVNPKTHSKVLRFLSLRIQDYPEISWG